MRIDKYLKVSRLAKRRSEAHDALVNGRIAKDGKPLKPGYDVKVGDVIELHYARKFLTVRILHVPLKVTPALKLVTMYEVISEKRDDPADCLARRVAALSGDTKDALSRDVPENAHCRAALRDGLATFGSAPGAPETFRTQRAAIARLAWSLLDDRKGRPIVKVPGTRLYRMPTYTIDMHGYAGTPRKATARCDRRMELRAAFLGCGSLAVPARGYHLEFLPPTEAARDRLVALLKGEGIVAKRSARGRRDLVYLKNVDEISRFLAAIGASGAVFNLEDARALKETKNRIHRLVNTEAANVDRATSAAAAQAEAIALLVDAYGLANVSKPLREAAELRLAYPDETLAELGRRCSPPVSKSTINGRIAALVRLARGLGASGQKKGLHVESRVTN